MVRILWPNHTIWRHKSSIGSGNRLLFDGNNPQPKQLIMLSGIHQISQPVPKLLFCTLSLDIIFDPTPISQGPKISSGKTHRWVQIYNLINWYIESLALFWLGEYPTPHWYKFFFYIREGKHQSKLTHIYIYILRVRYRQYIPYHKCLTIAWMCNSCYRLREACYEWLSMHARVCTPVHPTS